MKIITEHSFWWLLPIIIMALAYSFLLYYRNRHETFSLALTIALASLRFLAVFFLGVLLLNPLLKTRSIEKQKPIIVMLQDQSTSLQMNGDTSYLNSEYQTQFEALADELGEDYELKKYAFGDEELSELNWDYTSKSTDISWAIDEVQQRYNRLNLGAVILASDGIYNRGVNPNYSSSNFSRPIYTIALGDTAIRKDMWIQRLAFNEVAYVGNQFPIEVEVNAQKLKGKKSRLVVFEENKRLFTKELLIDDHTFSKQFRFYPEAKKSGTVAYRVVLEPIEGELSEQNNTSRFFIEVIDSKKKILILYESAHPDVGALHAALKQRDQYEIELKQAIYFTKAPEAYNLIITHQLPSASNYSNKLFQRIKRSGVPMLTIIGHNVHIPSFNRANLGIQIQAQRMQLNEAFPLINSGFDKFYLEEEFADLLSVLPPLHSPFGKYQSSQHVFPIIQQKIGKVQTNYPLVAVADNQGQKSGFIMGEGIWRWRLYSFAETGSHNIFDNWIEKMVQYLSLSEEKKRFSVLVNRKFQENQPVVFTAQLYNASYEAVKEADISVVIKDEQGEEFNYSFGRRGNRFYLDAGRFDAGRYSYSAKVKYGEEVFVETGSFIITPIRLEGMQLTANHNVLQLIANETGGEMLMPDQLSEIKEKISQREDIASIRYEHFQFRDIIDWHWLLLGIVILLSIEWFVRKYSGSY